MSSDFPNVGELYGSQELIRRTAGNTYLSRSEFLSANGTIEGVPNEKLLVLCEKVGWIHPPISSEMERPLVVSTSGLAINSETSAEGRLRLQIKECIQAISPRWRSLIVRGISECQNKLPPPIAQAFREADLFDPSVDAVVNWWDSVVVGILPSSESLRLATGRRAEKLTLDYEARKTGRQPSWIAVLNNSAGYDVLSSREANDRTPLRIEVKGTTLPLTFAKLHITRNEWITATSPGAHEFHIWFLSDSDSPQLRVIGTQKFESHMPVEKGAGQWDTVEIPIAALSEEY